jgi:hypothetical protein
MTREKNRIGIEPHNPYAGRAPRVLLKTHTLKTGYLDGAWWPHGHELASELSALLTVLAVRLDPIHRAICRLGDRASTCGELVFAEQTV